MTPSELIQWAVAVSVGVIVLSVTGIQEWFAKLVTQRPTRRDLERRVTQLEQRLAELERTASNSKPVRQPSGVA